MADNIALQLYSVRNLLPNDFEGTVRRVAAMGYTGVESGVFTGITPTAAAQLFKTLGLKMPAMHIFPRPGVISLRNFWICLLC